MTTASTDLIARALERVKEIERKSRWSTDLDAPQNDRRLSEALYQDLPEVCDLVRALLESTEPKLGYYEEYEEALRKFVGEATDATPR